LQWFAYNHLYILVVDCVRNVMGHGDAREEK